MAVLDPGCLGFSSLAQVVCHPVSACTPRSFPSSAGSHTGARAEQFAFVKETAAKPGPPGLQAARSAQVLQEALLEASSAMRELQALQRQRRLTSAALDLAPAQPDAPERQGVPGARAE